MLRAFCLPAILAIPPLCPCLCAWTRPRERAVECRPWYCLVTRFAWWIPVDSTAPAGLLFGFRTGVADGHDAADYGIDFGTRDYFPQSICHLARGSIGKASKGQGHCRGRTSPS